MIQKLIQKKINSKATGNFRMNNRCTINETKTVSIDKDCKRLYI